MLFKTPILPIRLCSAFEEYSLRAFTKYTPLFSRLASVEQRLVPIRTPGKVAKAEYIGMWQDAVSFGVPD